MFNINPVKPVAPAAVTPMQGSVTITQLEDAAKAFDARRDGFAQGKGAICRDMAAKLRRYGSFASEKQAEFARKLVEWSKPRTDLSKPLTSGPAQVAFRTPDLFAVMQKHSHFYAGALTLARKNQDSLVWIKHERYDGVIGRIENGIVNLFDARIRSAGIDRAAVVALLEEFEANPLAAAMKHGKLSGRCCSCGRDLTDPESIERGIGPTCAQKFSF